MRFDEVVAPRDEIYQFVDLKDQLVKVDNTKLEKFEDTLNFFAE